MKTFQGKLTSYYRRATQWALMITCAILLGHYFLPPKRVELSQPVFVPYLYGFSDPQTGTSARWIDEENQHWVCDYKPSHAYGCGWSVSPDWGIGVGMDIRGFDALEIELQYRGPASRIRVYIRNNNPAYTDMSDPSTSKPMETSFPAQEANAPVLVRLSDFAVASWWLTERKNRRHWPMPELNNILSFGVDFVEQGRHEVKIHRVTLLGRWIRTEALLITVLLFWMTIFLVEGGVRFYWLYRTAQEDSAAIKSLMEKQRSLEQENQHLESLADTDPLTGIYNRSGLRNKIEAEKMRSGTLNGLGILLLDLDHFKQLNDRYGHDMGDKVLKAFSSLLAMNLRNEDIFARMGGEEFIVVCRRQPLQGVYAFAEKLRTLAGQCTFNGEADLHISVSIGVSVVGEDEDFASAMNRADQALYRAKQNGRNRVEYTAVI